MSKENGTITKLFKETKSLVGLIFLFAIVFAIGYGIHYYNSNSEYELLLSENTALIKDIKIAENKTNTLDSLIKKEKIKSKQDRSELLSIIKSLEAREKEIKEVVKIKTIIKAAEPKIVTIVKNGTCEVPPDHTFKFKNGLSVAKFHTKDDDKTYKAKYETADVTFETNIVISDDKTAVLLKAESSLEPNKKVTIPIDEVKVTSLKQYNTFEPHIQINVSGSLDTAPVKGDFTAGISTPLFHLIDKRLDMLAPKINFGKDSVRLGADIIGYNIGHDLPVITDTWVSLGISWNVINASPYPGIDISIGSKF